MAQQVVERGQRLQVFLDRGGPFQRIPIRALLLDGADHDARQSAAGGELDAVGEQVEQQPDAVGHDADRVADPPRGGVLGEAPQPVPDPGAHGLVLRVSGIGQGSEELGVAVGAAAVLGRAGALPTNASRLITTAREHLDLMLPAVTEVVFVDEVRRQRGDRHAPFVDLGLAVFERNGVDGGVGAELVEVRVGPAECDLQDLVQLNEGDGGGYVDQPLHPRLHLAHGDPQPDRPHRDPPEAGAAQHFLYFRPEPHQHGSLRPGGQAIVRDRSRPRSAAYRARSWAGSRSSAWLSATHWVSSEARRGAISSRAAPVSRSSPNRRSMRWQ